MNIPKHVILHCSATPDYPMDHMHFDKFGAKEIRYWHVNDNKWNDIGYHWVIRQSGLLETGRSETEIGAHCLGHNDAIGVCYVGSYEPNENQITCLGKLFLDIYNRLGIVPDDWYGHNEFSDKDCPGISMVLVRALFTKYQELN